MPPLPSLTDATFLLKLRLFIYISLMILSFFIFVSIGVMMDQFYGACPLYADLQRMWIVYSASRCQYPMVIAILFQLLYLLFRLVLIIPFYLGKLSAEMFLLSDKMEIVYVLVDALAFFLTFIGACILSAGMAHYCSNVYNCNILHGRSAGNVAQAGAWLSTFFWLFIAIWGVLFIWKTGKLSSLKRGQSSNSTEANKS